MLLSAVQIKAQHRVAVGAVLDALGAGLIAGLQDLHVGLGRVRVGDGPGGKGLVIILNNLGTDAAAIPQRRVTERLWETELWAALEPCWLFSCFA